MKTYCIALLLLIATAIQAQTTKVFADSIRKAYDIPELAYAVVSTDSIFELHALGAKRVNTNYQAELTDRFHIGSNTKAITAFIAYKLVREGKIQWETKFFDLFPKLKQASKKAYHNITLHQLLTYHTALPKYTYTFNKPDTTQITGDNAQQRYLLAQYFLQQKPVKTDNGYHPTNVAYVLAGLMLEKASGKGYKVLVDDLGKELDIHFGFDNPNQTDTLQTWGHNAAGEPVPPKENVKLNWLLTAGNINVSLPEYIHFIQLLLKDEHKELLWDYPPFSNGWFILDKDETGPLATNTGNAGAFITQVTISKQHRKAVIIFTNSFNPKTNTAIGLLEDYLMKKHSY